MFLRSKVLVYPTPYFISVSKRLLSNEIRQVLNTRLEPPAETNSSQIQLSTISKNLNAFNLDLFVNNLSQFDDRKTVVLDLLASLRATKLANTCLDSTQFAVVRYLLENSTIQELVSVLTDRQQYGLFLNNFTAFAVTQTLHSEGEYNLGLPLVLKLILLDELDSIFVQAFCIKSVIEHLKMELSNVKPVDEKPSAKPKEKIIEKKVRVKFLRNEFVGDQHYEMGKAILKIAPKILKENTRDNAMILGFVLTKNYAELEKVLNANTLMINEDISMICKELLSKMDKSIFVTKIENIPVKQSFSDCIDEFLKTAMTEEAPTLAEKQKEIMQKWQPLREQTKLNVEMELSEKERIENVNQMEKEISTKKEMLWFFSNEDEIDLKIYNKRVYYPKRWFGKKKKPRVLDEHYVPPQIRRIN